MRLCIRWAGTYMHTPGLFAERGGACFSGGQCSSRWIQGWFLDLGAGSDGWAVPGAMDMGGYVGLVAFCGVYIYLDMGKKRMRKRGGGGDVSRNDMQMVNTREPLLPFWKQGSLDLLCQFSPFRPANSAFACATCSFLARCSIAAKFEKTIKCSLESGHVRWRPTWFRRGRGQSTMSIQSLVPGLPTHAKLIRCFFPADT